MADVPDEDLVRRHLAGDRGAFDVLMARHQGRVYGFSHRMLGRPEDAADATQEVFLTCLRKLAGFRGEARFSTWLYRVTVNVCHDALRRRARERPSDDDPDEAAHAVPDPASSVAGAADVERALRRLPEEFRVVLLLHDVQDVAYEDIAEALGTPLGTVKSRLHRARVALARALAGEPPGPSHPSNYEEAR